MLIFWRLVLAHLVADFTLQTNHVAAWKRESRWGMAVHIATHPAVYVVFVWPYLNQSWVQSPWWSLPGWACVFLVTFFHWLEDVWRVWSIHKVGSPDSTGFLLWDQVVHLTFILAFSPVIEGASPERWVLLAILAVALTHFTSVLVYFLENDLLGSSQVLDSKKYRYIGERLAGVVPFILPGWGFVLVVAWAAWVVHTAYRRSADRTWIHLVTANASVLLCGLVARGLLYR